jgi:hypothetical protein
MTYRAQGNTDLIEFFGGLFCGSISKSIETEQYRFLHRAQEAGKLGAKPGVSQEPEPNP